MRFIRVLFGALLFVGLNLLPAHADKRVALVIGNGDYQHADKLANPVTDARRLRDALARLGFDVVYGENLGKQTLERTIGRFANVAQGADVALVYFAGHGATFGDVPYVVPVDAQFASLGEVPYELVPVETLIGELRRAKGLRVAILDACRDDSAERDLKRVASRGGEIIRGLARVKNPEGLILAYATQYLSTAADGDPNGDSPFTTALLNNIATPGLDVKDMFFKVGSEVIASTRGEQRPEISISFYDSYILVPAAIVPAAPPAVSPPPAPPPAAPPLAAPPPITSAPEAKPQSPGGAPPPAGPSAEEIAWGLLKDTKDADQLRRFIQQFPRSPQRAEAEQRVTALDLQAAQPAKPAPMPELERAAMTRSLQLELKRVGCFDGTVDAELGGGTRDALRNFAKFAALSLPQGDPTPDVINKIKGFNKRVCPLVCPAGEKAQGELCMHVEPKARPAPSKPHPAARTDSGHGRCFSFQGRQICE